MAEGRMLKKKISLNEALANLDNDTHRLLFTWAIPHLDVEGRITGSPRVFKATVAPLLDHLTPNIIDGFFQDAHTKGLITYYEINGEFWVEYPKFSENQNIKKDREAPSKIPPSPENSRELQSNPELSTEVKRREEKLREGKERTPSPPPKKPSKKIKTPIPENFTVSDRVKEWAKSKGFDRLNEHLEAFKLKVAKGGLTYVDWDAAFMEAVRGDWAGLRNGRAGPAPALGRTFDSQCLACSGSGFRKPRPGETSIGGTVRCECNLKPGEKWEPGRKAVEQ